MAKITLKPCAWRGNGTPTKFQAIAYIVGSDLKRRMIVGDPCKDRDEALTKLYNEVLQWQKAAKEAKKSIFGSTADQIIAANVEVED